MTPEQEEQLLWELWQQELDEQDDDAIVDR